MNTPELHSLEQKIDALIHACSRLSAENHRLQQENASLANERDALREKNDTARGRVEAMIERLKMLETEV